MGKTSFDGPVYGSKATLFSGGPYTCSTGSSATFAGGYVPAGEDWYATELAVYRNSTGQSGLVISLQSNSTTVGSVTIGSSAAAASTWARFTPSAGEYEGVKMAAGTAFTLSHSSHADPNANVSVTLRGFTRFVSSTRSE